MELAQIEKKAWEILKHELSWGGITLTKNSKAIYLTFKTPSHKNGLAVKKLLNVLKNDGHFFDHDTLVLAPIETNEQRLSFAEVKASLVGTRVLKHQEQTIKLLAEFRDSLQELKDLKVELGVLHEA